MKESLDKGLDFVLKWEGGYVNDPNDKGGETKYGISKRAYPNLDIKGLTLDEAKTIYRRDYWDVCKCDNLPYPMDILVFDTSVNMGVSRASHILSESINSVDFIMNRIKRYVDFKGQVMEGWLNRVFDLYRTFVRPI